MANLTIFFQANRLFANSSLARNSIETGKRHLKVLGRLLMMVKYLKYSKKAKCARDKVIHIHSFSENKTPTKRRLEREKYNGREFIFAQYVAKGLDPIDAYLRSFPTNKRSHAELSAKLLLKTKRVQKLISQKIEEKMDSLGLSEEWLLDEVREIIENRGAKDNNKLRALDMLMKIRGMFPTSEQKTESLTVFQGFTPEQLKAIQKGDTKKLKSVEAEIEK